MLLSLEESGGAGRGGTHGDCGCGGDIVFIVMSGCSSFRHCTSGVVAILSYRW